MPFHAQRMSSLLALDREFALCRESKEGYKPYRAGRGVRVGRREAAGDRGAGSVQGRARLQIGARHGEECTENISRMLVTLEVSKLSGWLNADAACRKSKGGHAVRCEGAG